VQNRIAQTKLVMNLSHSSTSIAANHIHVTQ